MARTYNFLKIVSQKLKGENNRRPLLIFILLPLVCIPLPYQANSIALILFTLATIVTFKKRNFRPDRVLMLPILLYFLMLLSLLWTIDMVESAPSISKELPLLVIPFCFMAMPLVPADIRQKIIRYFSFAMAGFSVFYLIKAVVRFVASGDTGVFFYHELVTKDVNAIYVSALVGTAFFYFLAKLRKSALEMLATAILLAVLILLSSKNVIATCLILGVIYFAFFSNLSNKAKWAGAGIAALLIASLAFVPEIRDRFNIELSTITTDNTVNYSVGDGNVHNISIRQAWNNERFEQSDFFPGTAFRVYQFRIFLEMMAEDNAWLLGYGLNASYDKIEKKTLSYNLFSGDANVEGYQKKNFHNQYIQAFADLGVAGFLLIVAMLAVNLKNGIKRKDFVHISFAVLMISLFLTESFLWRQRGVTFFTMMFCLLNVGSHRKE